ncbi:hypothetical protein [Actinomadura gamaensis]|uniref:Uncharacterized protein n=1 Tax=Actinomadura gamaensis TaxID=1763541 RepID=A0ABV9U0Q8_9ACTN
MFWKRGYGLQGLSGQARDGAMRAELETGAMAVGDALASAAFGA